MTQSFWRRYFGRTVVIVAVAIFTLPMITADGAYWIARPVAPKDEPPNQGYLYGEPYLNYRHKGLDWSNADTGESVYAVEDGVVTDINEEALDGCTPGQLNCGDFGNYVLIQHDKRHYDRGSGTWSYVYSLYAHLRYHQVYVQEGFHYSAGTQIAQSDDTGNSDGDHLHLQIIIHPDANMELGPDLGSEDRSRNPELWLSPYSGTATAVGRVTDNDGNLVGDKYVYGLQKPWGGYGHNETYAHVDPPLNPDDILVENWGTTDVTPGTYDVEARNDDDTLYQDFGETTFVAGQTTYIGLYPNYMPGVYHDNGWVTDIAARNNSADKTARANSTFVYSDSAGGHADNDIPTRGRTEVAPSMGYNGSAVLAGSEDTSIVAVRTGEHGPTAAYTGLRPERIAGLVQDANCAVAGSTVYQPHLYNNYGGYTSQLSIMNVGAKTTGVTINYYKPDGDPCGSRWIADLAPYVALNVNVTDDMTCPLGSARIASNASQPLAVVASARHDSGLVLMDNTAVKGATEVWAPYLMRNYYGWRSCMTIRNLGASTATVQVTYYWGTSYSQTETLYIGGDDTVIRCHDGASYSFLGTSTAFSAKVTTNQAAGIAVVVNQDLPNPSPGQHMSYSSLGPASPVVVFPYLYNEHPDETTVHDIWDYEWTSGFVVQNTSTETAYASCYLYDLFGNYVTTLYSPAMWPGHQWGVYLGSLGYDFIGSAEVEATQPIVGVANATCGNCAAEMDKVYTYNGVNR